LLLRVAAAVVVQLPQAEVARVDSVRVQVLALPLAPTTPLRLEQVALAETSVVVTVRHIKEQPAAILFSALLLVQAVAVAAETAPLSQD
jgi:hypothetical protein